MLIGRWNAASVAGKMPCKRQHSPSSLWPLVLMLRASDSMWYVDGDVDGRTRRTALLRARFETLCSTAFELSDAT